MSKKKVKRFIISICFILICFVSIAQKHKSDELLNPNEKYANYITKLKSGQTNIDYADFRTVFSMSEEFMNQDLKKSMLESLNELLSTKMDNKDKIIEQCYQILDVDYTEIGIHYLLSEFLLESNKETESLKHKEISTGLKDSILKSGNGNSCKTGYHVIKISEIFDILNFMNAEVISKKNNFSKDGISCYEVKAKINGKTKKIYFDTTVMMGYILLKDSE